MFIENKKARTSRAFSIGHYFWGTMAFCYKAKFLLLTQVNLDTFHISSKKFSGNKWIHYFLFVAQKDSKARMSMGS